MSPALPPDPHEPVAPGGTGPTDSELLPQNPANLAVMAPRAMVPTLALPRQRGRRRLRLVFALLLLVLVGGGAGWWTLLRPLPVAVTHPSRGPAVEAVYATGVVEAIDSARVGTTVAARIVSLLVDEGDTVRRGQLLATLDDREAQHRLADARARLVLADQELARDRTLTPQGVRSLQSMQRDSEERDRAAAGVAMLEKELADYRIESPLDGIVMQRPVQPGETLAANAELFDIASPTHLRIAADVDERDIPQVRMGAPVAIQADAFAGRVFTAAVTNIRRQGDVTTRTYRVEAALPADTPLLIGMTVDVNIEVSSRPDALLVPETAVRHAPAQGGLPGAAYVFRIENGIARRTEITAGAIGPKLAEVRAGLAPDAELVADPPDRLRDGARVRALP